MVNIWKSFFCFFGFKFFGFGFGFGVGVEFGVIGGSSYFIFFWICFFKICVVSCFVVKVGGSGGVSVILDEVRKVEVDGSLSDSYVFFLVKCILK